MIFVISFTGKSFINFFISSSSSIILIGFFIISLELNNKTISPLNGFSQIFFMKISISCAITSSWIFVISLVITILILPKYCFKSRRVLFNFFAVSKITIVASNDLIFSNSSFLLEFVTGRNPVKYILFDGNPDRTTDETMLMDRG